MAKSPKKQRLSVYLEPDVMKALSAHAARRGHSLSLVAEAGIASFLSPDAAERQEAAITKRLDQLDRRMTRMERDVGIIVIEDTRELQCTAPNLVAMRTKDGVITLSELVRSSLRLRPDRIPIGEVRGAEALDLLKAWGTGHPGGVGTIHAGTAVGALRRLEQLIQEAVVTVPRALIAETINLVAVLSGRGASRRLAELAHIEGLGPDGDYRVTPATQSPEGELP